MHPPPLGPRGPLVPGHAVTWIIEEACLILTKCFLSSTALKRRCSAAILLSTSWWSRLWRCCRSASRRNTCTGTPTGSAQGSTTGSIQVQQRGHQQGQHRGQQRAPHRYNPESKQGSTRGQNRGQLRVHEGVHTGVPKGVHTGVHTGFKFDRITIDWFRVELI